MMSTMRNKFASWIVGGIVVFVGFVFVAQGVFSPRATRGLHEGAVAGTVNGDKITLGEFNKAVERRTEMLKNLGGGSMTAEQMKIFRIREGAFQELVQQKLIAQSAVKAGFTASDEQIRQEISKMPAFQKDGRFDAVTYRRTLEANNYTPAQFERMMRDQLSVDDFMRSLSARVKVSPAELKDEFLMSQDQRNVKYVTISEEAAQKVGAKTAKDAAEKVAGMMTVSKGSDATINAYLKASGATVQYTNWVAKNAPFVPGLGEDAAATADVFSDASPIDGTKGGKAKVYSVAGRAVVALVVEKKSPDLAKFESQKATLMGELRQKKERQVMDAAMKKMMEKAKIDPNPAVVTDAA